MSNESSGLEFNGGHEVLNNVLKPNFEFKGAHNLDEYDNEAHLTINRDFYDYEKESIDEFDEIPPVIPNGSDENLNSMQSPNKGDPVVIQQKYGASTFWSHK